MTYEMEYYEINKMLYVLYEVFFILNYKKMYKIDTIICNLKFKTQAIFYLSLIGSSQYLIFVWQLNIFIYCQIISCLFGLVPKKLNEFWIS